MTIIGHARAVARLVSILLLTAVCAKWLLFTLALHAAMQEEAARRIASSARIVHRWSRGVLRVLGVEVEFEGERVATPFLLVSNHLSYLDILVYSALAPGVFVGKAEIERWPVIGLLARASGTVFVERRSGADVTGVLAGIDRALDAGVGVVLFPEGTTTPGDRLLRFRSPLFEVAARRAFPVTPARVVYATGDPGRPPETAVCWWGDMTLVDHLYRLAQMTGVRARVTIGETCVADSDRKRLAARLQAAVESLGDAGAPEDECSLVRA